LAEVPRAQRTPNKSKEIDHAPTATFLFDLRRLHGDDCPGTDRADASLANPVISRADTTASLANPVIGESCVTQINKIAAISGNIGVQIRNETLAAVARIRAKLPSGMQSEFERMVRKAMFGELEEDSVGDALGESFASARANFTGQENALRVNGDPFSVGLLILVNQHAHNSNAQAKCSD